MFENVDEELLSAYLDDEVTPDQRAQVERRLRDSPDWRRLFDELRALRASIMALPRYRLDEDLDRRVLADAERRLLNTGPREPIMSNPIQANPLLADPDRPSAGRAGGPRLEPGRDRTDGESSRDADSSGAGLTPPADAPDGIEWPRLRFPRGWRAWAWPAVAVAAALLIRAYENPPQPQKVAQAPPAEAPAAKAASGNAPAAQTPAEKRTAAKKSSEEWRPRHAPEFEGPRETSIGAAPSPATKATKEKESITSDERAPAPPDAALRDGAATADRVATADRMAKGEPSGDMEKSKDSVAFGKAPDKAIGKEPDKLPDKALDKANENSEFPPADDGVLVVEAALRPEAAERGAFIDLLARNSIGAEAGGEGRLANQLSQSRMAQSPLAQSPLAQSPLAQSRMLQSNRNDAGAQQSASVAPVSEVYVEASPRQIAAALAEMQQRADEFAAVAVQPAAQSSRQQQFVQFNCNRIDGSFPPANGAANETTTATAEAKAALSNAAAAAPAPSRLGGAMRGKAASRARAANQPQAPAAGDAYRYQGQLNDDVGRQAETRRQSNVRMKEQAADGAARAEQAPAKQASGGQAPGDKADGEKAPDDEAKMRVVFLLWTAQPTENDLGRPTAPPAPAAAPASALPASPTPEK